MASTISSLGIGSGVLTADVIDQLKEADASKFVTPLETKLELNSKQQEAYGLVTTYMNTLKASVSTLSYDTLFENNTVNISGDAEVVVSSGANVESFTLETTTLAKKEISQFGALASREATIASGSGTYTITVGAGTSSETSYDIPYDDTTTLSTFTQSITDIAGEKVSASILETSDGAFNLVLASQTTGAAQALSFSDAGAINDQFKAYDATTNPDGYQEIQAASDAAFKYNGISITRDTNDISDLVIGLDITLKTAGDFSTVDVQRDNTSIVEQMTGFVENYNTLIANLNDMTIYDKEAGTKGIFQGNSFIKGVGRDVTSAITQIKNGDSLVNYGISLNRDGSMTFDSSAFEEKLTNDIEGVKSFFTGGVDSNGSDTEGIFTALNDKMKSYTGYGELLSTFETSLKTDATNLETRRLSAQESLDIKYEIMSRRFSDYDSIINQTNSAFTSVQMMIDAMSASSS